MNLYLIIIVFIILFLVSTIPINAKEYVNEKYGIKFEYPDEWELQPNKNLSLDIKNKISLVNLYPDPDSNNLNFLSLVIYNNVTNPDVFLNEFKKELYINKEANIDVLNIKKYKNIRGQSTLLIKTIYTPIATGSLSDFDLTSSEIMHILFQEDGIGYKITYSLPLDLAYKYQNDVFSIALQIRDNKR